jgi:hypothetical protein
MMDKTRKEVCKHDTVSDWLPVQNKYEHTFSNHFRESSTRCRLFRKVMILERVILGENNFNEIKL